jgi:hypothetical protein
MIKLNVKIYVLFFYLSTVTYSLFSIVAYEVQPSADQLRVYSSIPLPSPESSNADILKYVDALEKEAFATGKNPIAWLFKEPFAESYLLAAVYSAIYRQNMNDQGLFNTNGAAKNFAKLKDAYWKQWRLNTLKNDSFIFQDPYLALGGLVTAAALASGYYLYNYFQKDNKEKMQDNQDQKQDNLESGFVKEAQ